MADELQTRIAERQCRPVLDGRRSRHLVGHANDTFGDAMPSFGPCGQLLIVAALERGDQCRRKRNRVDVEALAPTLQREGSPSFH
jgi:hypothetical protein